MNREIDEYLRRLKQALGGADKATVQDALADAEEHLTNAAEKAREEHPAESPERLFTSIIEEYGSPEEVAMAYRDIEEKVSPALAPRGHESGRSGASRFFGVVVDPRAYAAFLYMLISLVTGICYFTWAVTGLSLSAGLIILIIGLPVLTLFLISVRGIALVEGRLVEAVLGVRMPRRPVFLTRNAGWWQRVKAVFTDRSTWTAVLYMVLLLPLGIIYFTVAVTLLAVSAALIATPILWYGFHLPIHAEDNGILYYVPGWCMPFVVLAGILLFLVALHVAKSVGKLHGKLARALLVRGE